jgi:tetratricopeptide (TPR) repeat protein
MAKDQQGLSAGGDPESARCFDRAMADYYGLTGDPVGILKQAVRRDKAFALGGVAIAALYMIGGFRGDHSEVANALRSADAAIAGASERERRHLAATKALAAGRMREAIRGWEAILAEWPTDALALRLVEDAYYFLGRPESIRDCAARVLPAWDRNNALTSFVLGLYAFGLEESGDLQRAEDVGREALARNPRDAWAAHALAHVMETGARPEEGVAFLEATASDWSAAHFMAGHNRWHLALFQIELGRIDEVLAEYDRVAAPKLADDATLDRVDAASLLWRLELLGVDVGDRWAAVAHHWMAHVDDHVLAFNDLHCALAAARSPDAGHAKQLVRSLEAYLRQGETDNHVVTGKVGRPLVEGMLAFAAGDYTRAVERILSVRGEAIRIGGSYAQRDVIEQTLIAAAERCGHWRLAHELLAERAAARPTPPTLAAFQRARSRVEAQ